MKKKNVSKVTITANTKQNSKSFGATMLTERLNSIHELYFFTKLASKYIQEKDVNA